MFWLMYVDIDRIMAGDQLNIALGVSLGEGIANAPKGDGTMKRAVGKLQRRAYPEVR